MKKANARRKDELRPGYDFASMKGGVRGKYYARVKHGGRRGTNRFAARMHGEVIAVILEPDVAEIFDSAESVNRALRSIIAAVPKQHKSTARNSRRKAS